MDQRILKRLSLFCLVLMCFHAQMSSAQCSGTACGFIHAQQENGCLHVVSSSPYPIDVQIGSTKITFPHALDTPVVVGIAGGCMQSYVGSLTANFNPPRPSPPPCCVTRPVSISLNTGNFTDHYGVMVVGPGTPLAGYGPGTIVDQYSSDSVITPLTDDRYVEWTFDVAQAGTYNVTCTYAMTEARPLDMTLNDADSLRHICGGTTGGLLPSSRKSIAEGQITLNQGSNTISVTVTNAGQSFPHFNQLTLTKVQ